MFYVSPFLDGFGVFGQDDVIFGWFENRQDAADLARLAPTFQMPRPKLQEAR